jgi:hypothetical protein
VSTTNIVAAGRSYKVVGDHRDVLAIIAQSPYVNQHKIATFELADPSDSAIIDPYGVGQMPAPGTLVIDCATIEALS